MTNETEGMKICQVFGRLTINDSRGTMSLRVSLGAGAPKRCLTQDMRRKDKGTDAETNRAEFVHELRDAAAALAVALACCASWVPIISEKMFAPAPCMCFPSS